MDIHKYEMHISDINYSDDTFPNIPIRVAFHHVIFIFCSWSNASIHSHYRIGINSLYGIVRMCTQFLTNGRNNGSFQSVFDVFRSRANDKIVIY